MTNYYSGNCSRCNGNKNYAKGRVQLLQRDTSSLQCVHFGKVRATAARTEVAVVRDLETAKTFSL